MDQKKKMGQEKKKKNKTLSVYVGFVVDKVALG